ncbi:MAG: zinc-ribbon domain-containing protein [Atopobiaceae bacterium]|nr:zinc-ribbon domain-containing protein [Atopobiaceae bacterium]
MRCEKCGKENVDGARFCAQCGESLAPKPRSGALARGWLVAIGILGAIAAVLAVILVARPQTEPVVHDDSPAREATTDTSKPKKERADKDAVISDASPEPVDGDAPEGNEGDGKAATAQKGEDKPETDGAEAAPDAVAEAPSAPAAEGPYTLEGVVRVHAEDVGGRTVAIASVVLDEPVHFQDDYKGAYEGDAQEVALSTGDSDSYEDWAQYKDRRIVVECDGLRGAFHDAAFYNVDAVTLGEMRLIEAEELATAEDTDGDDASDVVHLDGCDLIIPDAWRGKVTQGNRYGDVTLNWNGFTMLSVRQCTPDDFLKVDRRVGTVELANGGTAVIKPGSDHSFDVEVTYGEGKGLMVYLFAYSDDLAWFFSRGDDECREYFSLQAAASGLTTDDDPDEVAIACLKACVQNLRFEGE